MNQQRNTKRYRTDIIEIERCLVGSVLLEPQLLDSISNRLSARSFVDKQLGLLFALLVDRHDAELPIDPVTLRDPAKSIFENPAAALAELFSQVPNVHHGGYYAGQVAEASKLRQLEQIGSDINNDCHDFTKNSASIVSMVDARLAAIGDEGVDTTVPAYEAGNDLLADIKTPRCGRPVATGLESFDNAFGGILPGELEIIAARPGIGKTSLAMQIAIRNAERSRPVLFVSLEMTAKQLIGRTLCGMTSTDSRYLRRGQVDIERFKQANGELESLPLFIFDPPATTMQRIRAVAKMQKATKGLDLLIVDYIGLIQPRDRKLPRHEQVTEITAELKRLAKELSVPVIALCQLNRQADGAEPRLSHLRESGSIEQDADVVLFIHRAANNKCKLIVGKHRHGETGSLPIVFNATATQFADDPFLRTDS